MRPLFRSLLCIDVRPSGGGIGARGDRLFALVVMYFATMTAMCCIGIAVFARPCVFAEYGLLQVVHRPKQDCKVYIHCIANVQFTIHSNPGLVYYSCGSVFFLRATLSRAQRERRRGSERYMYYT